MIFINLQNKNKNGLFFLLFNLFLNFIAPDTLFKNKRNQRLKSRDIYDGNLKDKYPFLLGGIGLFRFYNLCITINNYNIGVKKSTIQEHNKVI